MGATSVVFAKQALLEQGWAADVRLILDAGRIRQIHVNTTASADDVRVDTVLPALSNLHSHSFQRAMAGMTEHRVAGRESFWTWRDMMYRFINILTPEHVEAIAAQVFLEMQEAGYAAVGEFHYLHHQSGGQNYANVEEMSDRIFAAASETGIGLTHLPVLYTYGGAGQQALSGGQLRFGNSVSAFVSLVEACRKNILALGDDATVGIAPHSLRATAPSELSAVLEQATNCPVHIHVAEQLREVEEISQWLGARPVDWLLDHTSINASWCATHATHMTAAETKRLAGTGAVAGLCPVTEANLGDGAFSGPGWLAAGGAFGVGSDSNVRISLTEELRTLEYSQRLRDMQRNVLIPEQGSVGQFLYASAAKGGAQALGRNAGVLTEGKLADIMAIDSQHLSLCGLPQHRLLDGLCFVAPDAVVTDVWSAGRHMVKNGRHVARDEVTARYRKTAAELLQWL